MNAIGYQGIFEAAGHKLNDIGGVMLWKLNAAFPSVVWQVYDWYLMPNAGYYFMQNACEPVHAQLNLVSNKVLALNRTYRQKTGLTLTTDIYNIESRSIFHNEQKMELAATDVKEVTDLSPALSKAAGVNFVVLRIKDSAGKIISYNAYWLASDGDYKSVNTMLPAKVSARVMSKSATKNDKTWIVEVTNTTGKLAFFIRPQIMINGEEVLPSAWSAGYFTLAPGEKRTLTVTCPAVKLTGNPEIVVSGWNVPKIKAVNM